MAMKQYAVGDTVWYANGEAQKLQGRVVLVLPENTVPGYEEHYVIEVTTHVDDYLILRSIGTVAPSQNAPLAWFADVRDRIIRHTTKD